MPAAGAHPADACDGGARELVRRAGACASWRRSARSCSIRTTGRSTLPELIAAAEGCPIIVSDRADARRRRRSSRACRELVAFVRGQVDIRNVDVEAASADGHSGHAGEPRLHGGGGGMGDLGDDRRLAADAFLCRGLSAAASSRPPSSGRSSAARRSASSASAPSLRHLRAPRTRSACACWSPIPTESVPPPFEQVELDDAARAKPISSCRWRSPTRRRRTWSSDALLSRDEADGLADQCLARQPRRRSGAGARARRTPHRRRSARCRSRAGPEAVAHLPQRPDVIATPHIAGLTPQALEHQALETVRQTGRSCAARIPVGAVNAEHDKAGATESGRRRMTRHRIAIIGLGMAVTPHAKSLLDLKDRVEVAARVQPERGAARAFAREVSVSARRRSRRDPRRPERRLRRDPHAAEHASRSGAQCRRGRQAHPAGEAARGHDRARRRAGRGCREGRRDARRDAAASLPPRRRAAARAAARGRARHDRRLPRP